MILLLIILVDLFLNQSHNYKRKQKFPLLSGDAK